MKAKNIKDSVCLGYSLESSSIGTYGSTIVGKLSLHSYSNEGPFEVTCRCINRVVFFEI